MNKQKGMATLLTSVILTVIIALLVFWGARGSLVEQQSANNTYLTQVAFQHAEQGRVLFLSKIKDFLTANPSTTDFDLALSDVQGTTNGAADGKFEVEYEIAPDNVTATLTSTGYATVPITGASIGETTRKVSQRISFTAGGAMGPAALNSLGNINLQSGGASATSISAGGTITGNGVTAETGVQASSSEFRVTLLDHTGNVLKDSNGNAVTRRMTTDEYFMYYFGGLCPNAKADFDAGITPIVTCKDEVKAGVAANTQQGYVCPGDCGSPAQDALMTAAYISGKRIFWLSSGGIDHKENMGTEEDPVLIFVMNIGSGSTAAKINANSTIFGVLYVDVPVISTGTIGCSCKAQDSVTEITSSIRDVPENDLTKPIYTAATKQTPSAKQCTLTDGCIDSKNTKIDHNKYYTVSYQQIVRQVTYTSDAAWGDITYSLNPNQPAACTVTACTVATNKCTPPNVRQDNTVVNDTSACSFPTLVPAVSGTNDEPVEIEVLGEWIDKGTGNSAFNGSVISSGNITVTGHASYIQNSTVVANQIFGQGAGFTPKPATLAVALNSWTDMLDN